MLDAARIAAVIEILSQCENSWKAPRPAPADILMHRYFKERRFIGSKDRGAIAEMTYNIIRHYSMLEWWADRNGQNGARAIVITSLLLQSRYNVADVQAMFNGDKFSPPRLTPAENAYAKLLSGKTLLHPEMSDAVRLNYPQWMEAELKEALGKDWEKELLALGQEATVDLRANTLLTTRDALLEGLKKEGYDAVATPHSPIGVRLRKRMPVFTSPLFKQGWFEMQDEGSQLVSLLLDAKPGEKVIDFCAGAGGKTLAIAAQMKNKGRILAWDTSEKRLGQMPERLKRAKVDNVQRHVITSEHDAFIKRHKDSADAVIIDAPCSGSGTWRRNPDLKRRFTHSDLQEILAVQQSVLQSASRLVKKGGRMLYITCSLLQSENESQIAKFLQSHEKFKVVTAQKVWNSFFEQTMKQSDSFRLTPHQDGTDGFFASLLQRFE